MTKIPAALKMAKEIADDAAGRKVPYKDIWLERVAGVYGTHSVRYTLPKTEGFFACNIELTLYPEQIDEYESWVEANL